MKSELFSMHHAFSKSILHQSIGSGQHFELTDRWADSWIEITRKKKRVTAGVSFTKGALHKECHSSSFIWFNASQK
jgi:hypothetical protein